MARTGCACGHTAPRAAQRVHAAHAATESPSACPTPAPHADPAFREDCSRTVRAVPPPSRASRAPRASRTWRPSSWMAALLVVALVCTLPACSLADRVPTSRLTTSTPSAVAKYPATVDEDPSSPASSPASSPRAPAARRAQTRELDESLDLDAEPSRSRRPSPDVDDEAAKLLPDRRNHKGGRGARKQQRKRPREDDLPPVPLGQGGVLGGCNMCQEREAIRNWSLAAIKEQILHKLNLQQPPNITGRRLPPYDQVAYDLLHQPTHLAGNGMLGDDPEAYRTEAPYEEEDDYHAKTERIIAFPQTHINKVRHRSQDPDVLHFRFSSKVMQSQVAKATLWLFVRGTGVHRHDRHYRGRHHHRPHRPHRPHRDDALEDEDSVEGEEEDEEEEVVEEVRPQVVVNVLRMRNREHVQFDVEATTKVAQPEGEGVWVMVDVNKMVEDWFRRPSHNLGLSVHAHLHGGHGGDGRPLIDTDADGDDLKMPFIEVYLKESPKRRTRRAVGLDCDENSEESRCCRYPLVVDFELFGWDFIIFPKKYEANYCSGECPFVYMQKYPHTALMHLANNKTGPCCAPRKMSPINMLYFDNDLNVVFGVLPGMVVERCGCF